MAKDFKNIIKKTLETGIQKTAELVESGKEVYEAEKEKRKERLVHMFEGYEGLVLRRINFRLETEMNVEIKEVSEDKLTILFLTGILAGKTGKIDKTHVKEKGQEIVTFDLNKVDFGVGVELEEQEDELE